MDRRKSEIVKGAHITEKTATLSSLKDMDSNKSVRACKSPKYTFIVANWANKIEVRKEIEGLYKDQDVKVKKVNIVNLPGKVKKSRKKGVKNGRARQLKKAIVTLHENCSLDLEN
jgi:large subunit ribosomal protein L23